jgi:ribosomal protein S18 acetylase RimI-like enzyme
VDAVGCVMMRPVDRRTCEMKHLFVAAAMRGQNVGSRLCDALMTLAVHRGFHAMRLETGCENEEAIALYHRLGFTPCAPSAEYPDEVRALLRFMRADLTSRVRAR